MMQNTKKLAIHGLLTLIILFTILPLCCATNSLHTSYGTIAENSGAAITTNDSLATIAVTLTAAAIFAAVALKKKQTFRLPT